MHQPAFRLATWVALAVAGSTASADSPLRLNGGGLSVFVYPQTGRIEVRDGVSGQVWRQVDAAHPFRFTNMARLGPEALRFDTDFYDQSGKLLPATVTLHLEPRKRDLQVEVRADPSMAMAGFDGLPPFRPGAGSYFAVADYTDGHLYPCNIGTWPVYNLDHIHAQALDMPWIGVVDLQKSTGYSVIADTPFDCTFQCVRSRTVRAPWIHWDPEKGRFGYPRVATYHFAARGGYVDLPKAFRVKTRLVTLTDKARKNPNIRKLYGAAELWDFYDDVPDAELKSLGVSNCVHHVQTWSGHGANLREANRLGFVTEDYDYYLDGHPVDAKHPYLSGTSGHGYYEVSGHLAIGQDGKPIGEGDWLSRCPAEYVPVASQIIPARLAKFPTQAIYFDQITADYLGVADGPFGGGSLLECWSKEHPETRTGWKNEVSGFLKYVAGLGQIPAAEHGKWWETPYTSLFYGIPSVQWPWPDVSFPTRYEEGPAWKSYETWGSVGHAFRAPLWELVYHDCAVSMWYPWDTSDVTVNIPNDWMQGDKDANSVLYGIPAAFMVNGKGTGSWFKNRGKFMASYRSACKLHEAIADKEMLTHRFLSEDRQVQETTWSDGSHIVVNFGPHVFTYQGKRLDRDCWAAEGPWGADSRTFDPALGRIRTLIRKRGYRFDDGQGVGITETRLNSRTVRVVVDDPAGQTAPVLHPEAVVTSWPRSRTRVFACDPATGRRKALIAWHPVGSQGIGVGPFKGWTVLDVTAP